MKSSAVSPAASERRPSRWPAFRLISLAAFVAMFAGGVETWYLRLLASPPDDSVRAMYDELPYRKLPGFRRFILSVRPLVPPGSRVALWAPLFDTREAYSYAYYRASYLLADRRVLPLSLRETPTPRNLEEAEYLITFQGVPRIPGFTLVRMLDAGAVWRRAR